MTPATLKPDPPPEPRTGGIASAIVSLLTPAHFKALPPTISGVNYRERQGRGIRPLADIYLPPGAGPHPSVILVHGGGFLIGSRHMKPVRLLATRLCAAGYAVGAFDYRMILRGGRLKEALDDLDAMHRFWFGQAEAWHLDPARIHMAGFSAGAALMLLHANSGPETPLARLVSIYGAYDLSALRGWRTIVLNRLLFRSKDPHEWAARSPINNCRFRAPLLVIHGIADRLSRITHAYRLVATREAAGLKTRSAYFPAMPHAWLNDARLPESDAAIDAVLSFLKDDAAP